MRGEREEEEGWEEEGGCQFHVVWRIDGSRRGGEDDEALSYVVCTNGV